MQIETPWGRPDSHHETANGIESFSTPSHGGFRLRSDRQSELLEKFPQFVTFAGGPWYEEDCDYCAVVLAFPRQFDTEIVLRAYRQAKAMQSIHAKWREVVAYCERHADEFEGVIHVGYSVSASWS